MNSPQVNLVFFPHILNTILIQKPLQYYLHNKLSTEKKMRQITQNSFGIGGEISNKIGIVYSNMY